MKAFLNRFFQLFFIGSVIMVAACSKDDAPSENSGALSEQQIQAQNLETIRSNSWCMPMLSDRKSDQWYVIRMNVSEKTFTRTFLRPTGPRAFSFRAATTDKVFNWTDSQKDMYKKISLSKDAEAIKKVVERANDIMQVPSFTSINSPDVALLNESGGLSNKPETFLPCSSISEELAQQEDSVPFADFQMWHLLHGYREELSFIAAYEYEEIVNDEEFAKNDWCKIDYDDGPYEGSYMSVISIGDKGKAIIGEHHPYEFSGPTGPMGIRAREESWGFDKNGRPIITHTQYGDSERKYKLLKTSGSETKILVELEFGSFYGTATLYPHNIYFECSNDSVWTRAGVPSGMDQNEAQKIKSNFDAYVNAQRELL